MVGRQILVKLERTKKRKPIPGKTLPTPITCKPQSIWGIPVAEYLPKVRNQAMSFQKPSQVEAEISCHAKKALKLKKTKRSWELSVPRSITIEFSCRRFTMVSPQPSPHPKKTNKRTHKPTQQAPTPENRPRPTLQKIAFQETLEAPKAGFRPPLRSLAAPKTTPTAPGSFFRYAAERFS